MKINKIKNSFERSKKKNIGNFSFLLILLNQAFYLPILLIFGVEILKIIDYNNFNSNDGLIFILFILLEFSKDYFFYFLIWWGSFYIIVLYYKYFLLKKLTTIQQLECFFCEKKVSTELVKVFSGISPFFIIFGIPICEQHIKILVEGPKRVLIKGWKIFKKYRSIIRWFNILIIVSGIISISYLGFVYGSSGKLIIIILIFVLFPIQLILYFYLSIRMYIEIKKNLNKTNK